MPHKRYSDQKKNSAKGRKIAEVVLSTENEYQSAGVEFEESGEKWRAGDTAKATRFFLRAMETYGRGLDKFPLSFDLAYNSARLQYEMTQQPRLLVHLGKSLLELLQLALESHKFALRLEQDNADILFNTAQVLTSLAETISESKDASKESREQALSYFHEALEFFERCLRLQERALSKAEDQVEDQVDQISKATGGLQIDDAEPIETFEQSALDEEWVTIVEPVTSDTLNDTIIAQLETLTAICNLDGSCDQTEVRRITEYYSSNLTDKIMDFAATSARQSETWRVRSRFICALADVAFRLSLIDVYSYEKELTLSFAGPDIATDHRVLCDKADAEVAFSSSIGFCLPLLLQSQDLASLNGIRWRFLSSALNDLTTASKISDVQNLARVHLRRGDCELLRYQLGQDPTRYDPALRSAAILIKNAGTYYRGAAGYSRIEAAPEEEREAIIKDAIAASLSGDSEKLQNILSKREEGPGTDLSEIVEEMREEGLLSNEDTISIRELVLGIDTL